MWRPKAADLHKPVTYYLGRVTHTAALYRAQAARFTEHADHVRALGHAYSTAVHNAIVKGASFAEVAFASGFPVDPPAVLGLDDVHAELDAARGYDREQVAS